MAAIPACTALSMAGQIEVPISRIAVNPATARLPSPPMAFLNMVSSPPRALSQSPVKTPVIKSAIPVNIPRIFPATGASNSTARSRPFSRAFPSISSSGAAFSHISPAISARAPPSVCSWPHRTMTVSRNFSLLFHSRTNPAATAAITPAISASLTFPMLMTLFSSPPPCAAALKMVDRFFTAPTAAVAACSALKAPTAVTTALPRAKIVPLFSHSAFPASITTGTIFSSLLDTTGRILLARYSSPSLAYGASCFPIRTSTASACLFTPSSAVPRSLYFMALICSSASMVS